MINEKCALWVLYGSVLFQLYSYVVICLFKTKNSTNSMELLKPFQTNVYSLLYTSMNTMNLNTITQYEFASSRFKITCAPLHVDYHKVL